MKQLFLRLITALNLMPCKLSIQELRELVKHVWARYGRDPRPRVFLKGISLSDKVNRLLKYTNNPV